MMYPSLEKFNEYFCRKSVDHNVGNGGGGCYLVTAHQRVAEELNGSDAGAGAVTQHGPRKPKRGLKEDSSTAGGKKRGRNAEFEAPKRTALSSCYICGKTFASLMAVCGHLRWCKRSKLLNALTAQVTAIERIGSSNNSNEMQTQKDEVESERSHYKSSSSTSSSSKEGLNFDLNLPPLEDDADNNATDAAASYCN